MKEIISQPWPWYVAGPMIGLMVPLLLYFLNKPFGISSSLRHACAMVLPGRISYFRYNWKEESWKLVFVLGVAAGALAVQLFFPDPGQVAVSEATAIKMKELGIKDQSGLLPAELFSWSRLASLPGIVMLVIGGFLIGFGTRYADGCTSGHSIMGLSMLNPGSLVATIGFFIGGLIVSWLVLPFILSF